MKLTYLLGAEPLNTFNKRDMVLFLREFDTEEGRGRSYSHIVSGIKPIMAAQELKREDTQKKIRLLREEYGSFGYEFSEKEFVLNTNKSVMWVHLPDRSKESRNRLSDMLSYRMEHRYQPADALKLMLRPFSLVDIRGERVHFPLKDGQRIALDDLVASESVSILSQRKLIPPEHVSNDVFLTLDIETNRHGRLRNISLVTDEDHPRAYNLTAYPLSEDIDGTRVLRFDPDDMQGLCATLNGLIREIDPVAWNIYNAKFDSLALRKLLPGFEPGIEPRANVRITASARFKKMKKVGQSGMQTIDLYNYNLNHRGHWGQFDLETQAGRSGVAFKKGITIRELFELYDRADAGDLSAALAAFRYSDADGKAESEYWKRQKGHLLRQAVRFGTELETLCFSKLENIIGKAYDRQFFVWHGTHRSRWDSGYEPIPSAADEQMRLIGIIGSGVEGRGGKRPEKRMYDESLRRGGVFRSAALVAPAFLGREFGRFMPSTQFLRTMQDLKAAEGIDSKVDHLKIMNGLVGVPLKDILKIFSRYGLSFGEHIPSVDEVANRRREVRPGVTITFTYDDWLFGNEYHINYQATDGDGRYQSGNLFHLTNNVADALADLRCHLRKDRIINYSDFACVIEDSDDIAYLEDRELVAVLARGPAVSAGTRSIMLDGDRPLYLGMRLSSGSRSKFERRVFVETVRKGLGQLAEKGFVDGQELGLFQAGLFDSLRAGEVRREDLLYKVKRGEDKLYVGRTTAGEAPEELFYQGGDIDAGHYIRNYQSTFSDLLAVLFNAGQRRLF
ncbi:hypothetical protein JXB02_03295 [Candidatus Woesearchaeota archaeon]|nr:hypothetical protein [Candidatus Woesearchaeota archaeon]